MLVTLKRARVASTTSSQSVVNAKAKTQNLLDSSETGSAVTWKYPSCVLQGDNSIGEFYSVALTNGLMQADTGTKMIHLGNNTKSTIISKGISADNSSNAYRGLVQVGPKAQNTRNYTQCDSMLVGDKSSAHTFPYIDVQNSQAHMSTKLPHQK